MRQPRKTDLVSLRSHRDGRPLDSPEHRYNIRRYFRSKSSHRDNGRHQRIKQVRVQIDHAVPCKSSSLLQWIDTWPKNARRTKIQLLRVHSIRDHKMSRCSPSDLPSMDLARSMARTILSHLDRSQSGHHFCWIHRFHCVQISAISDLKGFSSKDQDEDRISKVKSAFIRDPSSDDGTCLSFDDLIARYAKT
ncbi:LOW QUALITY PROTEIN: hypothetical protein PHMEG_0007362 [Phytophthora megakarya]|uniref:Uncharacterized protein n=1 Tax=Phytophthora megakarya TaxID=4795 RepID=A0A225WLU5_9STRA|nr:LOW QUALITY PROTEIN: hypothetical protein PHMEG_0007362 [Phytophthora megakarya]